MLRLTCDAEEECRCKPETQCSWGRHLERSSLATRHLSLFTALLLTPDCRLLTSTLLPRHCLSRRLPIEGVDFLSTHISQDQGGILRIDREPPINVPG